MLTNFDVIGESYIQLHVYEVTEGYDSFGDRITSKRELMIENCRTNFSYPNKALLSEYNVDMYKCLKDRSFKLKGNKYSRDRIYLNIEITRCISNFDDIFNFDQWEIDEVVDQTVSPLDVEILMIDKYFDMNSFDDPIKDVLTERYTYSLLPGFTSNGNILLKENDVKTVDSFLGIGSNYEDKFYSIASERNSLATQYSSKFVNIELAMSAERVDHERSVFSILDVISQMGGFFGAFSAGWGLLLGFYSEKMMMMYTLFRNWYQVDSRMLGNEKK
jgi:hypothetical protein